MKPTALPSWSRGELVKLFLFCLLVYAVVGLAVVQLVVWL